jgi:hypothetical protein
MEGTSATASRESEQAPAASGRKPYALLVLAILLALAGTVALAVVALGEDSSAGTTTTPAAPLQQQTAFALFDEFHATLILSPGKAGSNTLDLAFATHDGSPTPDFVEVTVTAALPSAGGEPVVAPAEPVSGSPGLYRAELALPEAGDWELTVSVAEAGSQPVAESAVVPIGAR